MGLVDSIGDVVGGAFGSTVGGMLGEATSAVGDILKVVFPSIDQVTQQIGNYQKMLDDVVKTPIEGMMSQVANDGVWKGDGANLFVKECRSTFLPETLDIVDKFKMQIDGINEARDIMSEADKTSAQVANEVLDLAKGISKYF